jgi:beta-mannosidase
MLACGIYPKHESFVENVREEVIVQLKRLRNHPSIIFGLAITRCVSEVCVADVQDYQKAEQYDLYHPELNVPASDDPKMPARYLYELVFPELVKLYTEPPTPYKASSPFEGVWSNDPTVGDCHQWSRSYWPAHVG